MEPHIVSNIQWCETTKQIWASLEESYSQKRNVACIYELYELLFTKKNGIHVNEYLAAKKSLWEDLLQDLITTDLKEAQRQKKFQVALILATLDHVLEPHKT